jgi:hypothetical protein
MRVFFDGAAALRVESLAFEARNDRTLPAC